MFTLMSFTGDEYGKFDTVDKAVEEATRLDLSWWQYEIHCPDGTVLKPGVNFNTR